jgi:uncharacterized protein YcfJ
MKKSITLLAVIAAAVSFSSCANQGPNANQGMATGALLGAVAGGVIGNQSGRALEGAAIGAVGGGAVGSAYGTSQDQRYYQPQPRYYRPH